MNKPRTIIKVGNQLKRKWRVYICEVNPQKPKNYKSTLSLTVEDYTMSVTAQQIKLEIAKTLRRMKFE